MYNNEIWTKHTRLILTGVIIVAIAGWVAGILQTASIAIDTANDLLKAAGEEELPLKPFTLSAQTLTIIGYILYLVGLNGFKSIQKNYEASAMVDASPLLAVSKSQPPYCSSQPLSYLSFSVGYFGSALSYAR